MLTDKAGTDAGTTAPDPGLSGHNPLRTGGGMLQLVSPEGERISHPEFDLWIKEFGTRRATLKWQHETELGVEFAK